MYLWSGWGHPRSNTQVSTAHLIPHFCYSQQNQPKSYCWTVCYSFSKDCVEFKILKFIFTLSRFSRQFTHSLIHWKLKLPRDSHAKLYSHDNQRSKNGSTGWALFASAYRLSSRLDHLTYRSSLIISNPFAWQTVNQACVRQEEFATDVHLECWSKMIVRYNSVFSGLFVS